MKQILCRTIWISSMPDDESNNKESFDLNNLNYDEEYDTDEVIAFVPSEDMPVFPENIQKWLSKHVKYPQIALENGVQGESIRSVCG